MAHAIRIHAPGGSEVLKWEAIEVGAPAAGEATVRQNAVGLNYIDVYHRSGLYKLAEFPAIIGMEGAGTVEAVGAGRDRIEGRRPRRLCRCPRRLCRRAADPR